MLGAVRHEDGSGGSRQITHARLPQSGEEIVPEFGERGRRHRRTEARRNVQVFLAARNWFAVCVEEDDFQAASRTDDDAVFEDARRLKRSRGKAAREGGKEDRQRNEAEKKARCKRGRRAPAARRISVSHIPVPIGQRPAPFLRSIRSGGGGVKREGPDLLWRDAAASAHQAADIALQHRQQFLFEPRVLSYPSVVAP